MSRVGALSFLGLGRETAWNTPVAASAFFPFSSESLKVSIEPIAEAQIRGILDQSPRYKGLITIGGSFSGPVYPSLIGHLLRAALGAPTTTGIGPYTHTFNPTQGRFSNSAALPPYSITVGRDGAIERYSGCVCQSLSFSFAKGGMLTFEAQWIGASYDYPGAPTVALPTDTPFTLDALVQRNGVAFGSLQDISIAINNNIEGVRTINNNGGIISRVAWNGMRTIEVSGTADFDNNTLYNDFLAFGDTPWLFEWSQGANTRLTLTFPAMKNLDGSPNVGGEGRITLPFSLSAEYDLATGRAMQAVLVNNVASY